jgi:hypothetical protein
MNVERKIDFNLIVSGVEDQQMEVHERSNQTIKAPDAIDSDDEIAPDAPVHCRWRTQIYALFLIADGDLSLQWMLALGGRTPRGATRKAKQRVTPPPDSK